MKTSTKLFIVLLACIPLSMMVYIYLLRQQLIAGNFTQNIYNKESEKVHTKNIFKPLADFKYIVIEGDLNTYTESEITSHSPTAEQKNKKYLDNSIDWEGVTSISPARKDVGYLVLTNYENYVKTKIKHDTLFISFFKYRGSDLSKEFGKVNFFSLYTRNLKSIDAKGGKYQIKNLSGDSLSLHVSDARMNISKIEFKHLNVMADKARGVTLDSCNLNTLQYSLLNKSSFNLNNSTINNIQKISVDNNSKISIEGSALDMEKFLPTLSQSSK